MTTIPAEKLDRLVSRWETVQGTLASGADQETYVRLSREFAELDPIVATITALRSALREREGLQHLIDDPASEADVAALAEEEIGPLDTKIEELERQLKVQLLPKDSADEKSAILEVRAGTGGEEAALFAADLFRMYQRYADAHGWKVAIISASELSTGGYKEIIANITGKGVFARLKFESGVHRVQRVPETEAQGRIHTSAATVACCPRRKRWISRSMRRICASTCSGRAGRGASLSTPRIARCASLICHRASWSASRMRSRSTRTRRRR